MAIITYCDECGILVRSRGLGDRVLCDDCANGRHRPRKATRDSSRIPYSQTPTPDSVLEAIQATVRPPPRRATPCSA